MALNNGISDYIILDCRIQSANYIKTSVCNSNLKNIINLDIIDWNKCDEFATKNLVKLVCEKYNKSKMFSSDLAKEFDLSSSCIVSFLHKGNKLGWCKYDPKEMQKIGAIYSGRNNTKPITVIKNNMIIAKYNSINECIECCEKDLGVKFCSTVISKKIKDGKLYKGYEIKRTVIKD